MPSTPTSLHFHLIFCHQGSLSTLTCGKVLHPCRGDWEVLSRNANLGRREGPPSFALPQATLHCPSGGRNVETPKSPLVQGGPQGWKLDMISLHKGG